MTSLHNNHYNFKHKTAYRKAKFNELKNQFKMNQKSYIETPKAICGIWRLEAYRIGFAELYANPASYPPTDNLTTTAKAPQTPYPTTSTY